MDEDLAQMSREQLLAEVTKLRHGIRLHRDSTPSRALLAPPGLIACFYDRVEHDALISQLFPGGDSREHREHVAA